MRGKETSLPSQCNWWQDEQGRNTIRVSIKRRKNILIDYSELQKIIGDGSYDQLRTSHRGRVEDYLGDGEKNRQDEWTESIEVGNRSFIEKVKALLGFRAKGRKVKGGEEGYQLREGPAPYNALFEAEKEEDKSFCRDHDAWE
jgi:hypothetical protein